MNIREASKFYNQLQTNHKYGVLSIGALILAVIFVVIALALGPTVANSAGGLTVAQNANVTAAGAALFALTPVVYAAVVIVAMLAAFGLGG